MDFTVSPEIMKVATQIDNEKLRALFQQMTLIRAFESRIRRDIVDGLLPGFAHLYIGEEAVATGVCAHLNREDYVTSTHRGHGHCIAKGVDVTPMYAELMGKETGCCKGKGGSLHLIDVDQGMLGANSIVGAGMPIACGAALSAQLRGTRQVAVSFFGEGASNHGAFHESLNLASIWKLPVIFVIENNLYQDCTPYEYITSIEHIHKRAKSYSIPSEGIDGMNVITVYAAAEKMIEHARAGGGPSLLECRTYRYVGHYEGDPVNYRTREEEEEYKRRDCIKQFRAMALAGDLFTEKELNEIENASQAKIDQAAESTEADPLPEPEKCLEHVLAD